DPPATGQRRGAVVVLSRAPVAVDVLRPLDDGLRAVARRLRRGATTATLATLERSSGWPYASLVTVASALDGSALLLLSGLSHHTKALATDPRCSLLFAQPGAGDPLAHPRLTVFGRARFMEGGDAEHARARRRFLARHPAAARYVDLPDFRFVAVAPERALLNAGFGRASELARDDLLVPVTPALESLHDSEPGAVTHMNADHADAVRLIARQLCGADDAPWELVGLDLEGMDLRLGERHLRHDYESPLTAAGELRSRLVELARRARALAEADTRDERRGR